MKPKCSAPRTKMTEDKALARDMEILRDDIQRYFSEKGLLNKDNHFSKEQVRQFYNDMRLEKLKREKAKLEAYQNELLSFFANGCEVEPGKISPKLISVSSSDFSGLLFRFASLLWSAPVSKGFGRRLRFLIIDQNPGKLIGIFALGDPVFNLAVRDKWIGWDFDTKKKRLANVMDGYVVGAVPPYSYILGGKLVASLLGSLEVCQAFSQKYGNSTGIISGTNKNPQLALITISSVFGRSSIYARLKLTDQDCIERKQVITELKSIGYTKGYGHFQFSGELFSRIKELLEMLDHPYLKTYNFGQGSNWRFRVIREGLEILGLDHSFLLHGIKREVFVMAMADNAREFLNNEQDQLNLRCSSVEKISTAAINRWIIPRAKRFPEYKNFERAQILDLMGWNN